MRNFDLRGKKVHASEICANLVSLYRAIEHFFVLDVDVVVAADDGHVTRPNLDTILLSSKQSK